MPTIVTPAAAQTAPAAALPTGPGRNDLSKGEMAAFVFKPTPEELADVKFLGGDGKEVSLGGLKGKVVLLNLWATWCAPCLKEMPGLDRLQKELGSDRFEVVALAVDRTGLAGAKKFLDKIKVANLALYADPTAKAGSALKAVGMPATILIGKDGREIGRLTGPAEWDGPDAKKLIEAATK
jgi:thiol-disulfide isomerase/thioredoxin